MGLFSKLVWFTKFRSIVKVHALPLILGACSGASIYTAQQSGLVHTDILSLASNQAFLDKICTFMSVCLSASESPIIVSSFMFGAFLSIIFDKLYIAEAPKHEWLVSVNEKAEEFLDKVPEIDNSTPSDLPKSTSIGSKNGNYNKV